MRRPRLDLSALRACRWPRVQRAGLTALEFLDSQSRFSLTRREMLGIAGTAAASLPLKFGGPEGRLQFVPGHKRVSFRLDGREKWAIDSRQFAGTPALRVERNDKQIRVSLTGARYPGTELPADLVCELTRAPIGWRMRLKMALGGFDAVAPFERWLRGEAGARSVVHLDRSLQGVGESSRLALAGRAQAEFSPNWTLRLAGKSIARLRGFGGETVSDSLVIALLAPGEPSIVSKPQERRTLLAMNRGGQSWPFEPLLGPGNASSLVVSNHAFDRIRIESGESADGVIHRALIAESQSESSGIAFVPEGDLWASDGRRFRLPLRNPRYAVVADSEGQHAALVADYPRESSWVHAEGCSFEIGGSGGTPAFEAVSKDGQSPRILCAPSLKRIAAPLPGFIVEPRAVREGTQLAFLLPPSTPQEQIFLRKIQKKKEEKKKKVAPNLEREKKKIRLQVRPSKKKVKEQGEPRSSGVLVPTHPTGREPLPKTLPTGQRTPVYIPPGEITGVIEIHTGKKKALPPVVMPTRSEESFGFDFIRPDDLLALSFEFYNFSLAAGSGSPSLVRVQPNQPAYVVVQFWPQHIAEEAFFEGDTPQPLPKQAEPPIPSRLAGPSRLAFIVPDSMAEIPYTVESLLDWSKYEQSVTPLATPLPKIVLLGISATGQSKTAEEPRVEVIQKSPEYYQQVEPSLIEAAPSKKSKKEEKKREALMRRQGGFSRAQFASGQLIQLARVREPEIFQTAIEAPYRMILSPNYYAGWAHSTLPVERGGHIELWHTRLGVRSRDGSVDEQNDFYRTVRAVWATDYQEGCLTNLQESTPFASPTINTRQRYEIVRLSSDPTITTMSNKKYVPQPIQVNRLMLSTLGAWMNTRGAWDAPEDVREPACHSGKFSFSVVDWRHIAAMGRDQYVRIVERGYLFPFGHRAVKITITERKFNRTPVGKSMAAYLRQQVFVVVQEHEKNYPAAGQPNPLGPQIPFQTVRINTLSTPALDAPNYLLPQQGAFWPRVGNQDFQFKMLGVDWEGNTTEFTAPLIFVMANPARDAGQAATVMHAYSTDPIDARRVRPFFGQKVAYAKNKQPGDTTFETDSMSFMGEAPEAGQNVPEGQPYFYPAIAQSDVRIATVEELTGRNAATSIEYDSTYLAQGIESAANKGQVFARLLNTVPLMFGGSGGSSDKVGGLLTPSMEISGLSRLLGPVAGDLPTITGGTFDPKQFFQSALDAKLLGNISLADVINTVNDFSGAVDKVPKFVSTRLPNAVVTSFTWQPEVLDVSAAPGQPAYFKVTGDRSQALTVNAKLTKTLDNSPPSYEVSAALKGFEIHLVPSVIEVLILKFNELSFKSVNGKKPDVNADLAGIEFTGPLTFVNALKDLIPTNGFKDPPSLDVTAQGIEMGYSLALPPVSIGIFNLSNVSLAAQLNIYFTGDPITFQFDFCQEQQPFLLTVSLFGGGGYFGLTLTPSGIQRMAAELEFGGSFSLNLGVASGSVYVMAGLSYTYQNGNTELAGYLRCGGSLEVLAIITVSVEFKMSLTYVSNGNKVWGRATLTVEVKVLFFSKSVDLTVEREFAGGGTENAALFLDGAPYPLGPTPVAFTDQMDAADWQVYCEAFA
ncbi:MAG TPA: hypothetical protein VMV34_06870 [Terriglobia bacterium]|nr:hypothetical protein [Terriglobia bacterium]